jgi:hypothetical protein
MSKCNDYWCEYYGKGNEKCDRCVKEDNINDKPVLRVILKHRADEEMELGKVSNKNRENAQSGGKANRQER